MREAVIVSTARTPLAKSHRGEFNQTPGAQLGAFSVQAAVQRAGIDPGLMFSFPVVSDGEGGYEIVQGLSWSDFAKGKIAVTQDELREERAVVSDLLR